MMQKQAWLAVLFFALVCLSTPAAATPRFAADNEPDLFKRIAVFTAQLKQHPANAEAYFNRGTLYLRMGNSVAAKADLKQALAKGATFAAAYNNLGALDLARGDTKAALANLERAIARDPQEADAYVNRGILHFRAGDYDKALADFNHAIARNAQCAPAFAARGALHALSGQNDAAKSDIEKAVSLDRYESAFQYNLGIFSAAAADFQTSADCFQRALQGPLQAAAYYRLGQALLQCKVPKDAMYAFDRAAAHGLDRSTLNENGGYVFHPAVSTRKGGERIRQRGGIVSVDWSEGGVGGNVNFQMQMDGKRTIVTYTSNSHRGADKTSRALTPAEAEQFSAKLMELRPDEWAEYYKTPGIMCGTGWVIALGFADGSVIKSAGSNAFPPHYQEFANLLLQYGAPSSANTKSEG